MASIIMVLFIGLVIGGYLAYKMVGGDLDVVEDSNHHRTY